ncbi:exodeoxyribonuclease III [Sanguibacter sp. HDW7]|uniref:exodeoxyribonuclease III n=1 Tax=Sanguibacter sp. HDW7 TaxID=2714931 RepID=UPI00140A90B9|nr:exodeoxyribonuclease III [Sanguibacter sp. HDW7]QIK84564.1 exodeoxyribonuclease III [Sanguibacter sp. HDW7]
MRIATWNINSIRARADRALAFLEREDVDVLALQETKCKDAQFPREAFEAAGYEIATFGFSQWNGVAILSRVGLEDVTAGFDGQPEFGETPAVEARALGATCGGVRVWSLYVPHGRALDNPHYPYKLAWLARLRELAGTWGDAGEKVALVGDWNVVPLDSDVWDVAAFEGQTHVSEPEREAFRAFAEAGYTEVSRQFLPDEHRYTYWDYQQLRFPRNEGMRIDFAYTSPALTPLVTDVRIDRDERRGKGASDHVPVIVDVDTSTS